MTCHDNRDVELPAAPPLAVLDTYEAAMLHVRALHQQLYERLDANGEGAFHVPQG
jgi:hypothetical protein